jgi:curli biogenesis system outer membrane secretion channel CsgG
MSCRGVTWRLAVGLGLAVVGAPDAIAQEPAPTLTATSQPALAPLVGPKKRIAVAKFDAVGSFVAQYGSWDVGGGLSAQLEDALQETGRFIVVERAELAAVLREQEMSLQKVTAPETAVHAGQLLGAQLLVRGTVSEFDQNAGGGGLRIGVGSNLLGGGIGSRKSTGVVGIDLRLIDTATGQVVVTRKAEAKTSSSTLAAALNAKNVVLGGDTFNKSVLGHATREAIAQAVGLIVTTMDQVPWTGRIVEQNGDQVYVNAGAATGLQTGDVLRVSTIVRSLTDPETGTVLKVFEQPLGDLDVVSVEEAVALAKMALPFQTKRGDIVRFVRRPTQHP